MNVISRQVGFRGWPLTAAMGALLLLLAGVTFLEAASLTDGLRAVIRLTARTSLVLFLLAFSASSLARLFPGAMTGWLLQNRRYVGLSFAFSHAIHFAAIVALARTDYETFHRLTNIVTYLGGGLAYVFIVLMVLTSFDRTAALLGHRSWRWLHVTGMWYLWLSFALNFGKRIPQGAGYAVPVSFILLALLLRLLAMRRRGRAGQAI